MDKQNVKPVQYTLLNKIHISLTW